MASGSVRRFDWISNPNKRVTIALLVAAIMWVATNILWIRMSGLHAAGDAAIFVGAADKLLGSIPLLPVEKSYSGYVALLAFLKILGLDVMSVVLVQFVFSAAALWCVFGLGRLIGGELAGVLAAIAYAVNLDVLRWNTYILTDSLYCSCVVIAVYLASRRTRSNVLGATAIALLASTLRPTGWLLLPIILTAAILMTSLGRVVKGVAVLAIWGGFIAVMASSPLKNAIEYERPGKMLRDGVVVWGYAASRKPMPHDEVPIAGDWVSDVTYVIRYPGATANLAIRRIVAEVGHTRPFYSTRHNLAIWVWYYPMYLLAIIGVALSWKAYGTRLAVAVIAAHLILVAAMFADWDGRFIIHVIPLVTCLAAAGAAALLARAGVSLRTSNLSGVRAPQ